MSERPQININGKRNPEYTRWYREQNKERINAQRREWQKNNPDKARAYKISEKGKAAHIRYVQSEKGKAATKRYQQSIAGKKMRRRSLDKHYQNNPDSYVRNMVNHLKIVGAYDDYLNDENDYLEVLQ
jgi:hypothetical protein